MIITGKRPGAVIVVDKKKNPALENAGHLV